MRTAFVSLFVAGTCLLVSACLDPQPGGDENGEAASGSESEVEETGGEPGEDSGGEPEEDTDGWCAICEDPVDGSECGYEDVPGQWVSLELLDEDEDVALNVDLNEQCTVLSVAPTLVELACETYDPAITLSLANPWTPNFSVGDSMRLLTKAYNGEWSTHVDWSLNHADDSLAIAGRFSNSAYGSVGLGALAFSTVNRLCTPACVDDTVYEQLGVAVDIQGEQAILFAGNHAIVGDREIWVLNMRNLSCDKWGDSGYGTYAVFVSAPS